MATAEFFRALGDPTRLEMVRRLSSGKPYTMTSVSRGLEISRQGVRKHLQVLADAKMITLRPQGRDTYIILERNALERGKAFIVKLERRWDMRLEALRSFVDGKEGVGE